MSRRESLLEAGIVRQRISDLAEAREELGVEVESFHSLGTVYDPVELLRVPAEVTVFAVIAWGGEPVNAVPMPSTSTARLAGSP